MPRSWPRPASLPLSPDPQPSPESAPMQELLRLIELLRPQSIAFGPGTVAGIAAWAQARGFRRPLVIADAFNATRIDLLGLGNDVAVFGQVRPEPDAPNLEAALATAAAVQPDLVIGFG